MARYDVLIVDDEKDFREIMLKHLAHRDLHCDSAKDGATALKMIRDRIYDVVLLDVKMPGMDGIETLRELKKIAPMTEVIMSSSIQTVTSCRSSTRWFNAVPTPCTHLTRRAAFRWPKSNGFTATR